MGFNLLTYKCRDHLNNFDDEDSWMDIKAFDASEAAEEYADEIWPYSDGAESFEIEVKDPEGKITIWDVEVDFYPSFHASEKA